jgi:hypothetical protein
VTTLPNMGLVLPTRGAPGSGTWGDTIDANYALEDAHDHSTGKGLPVPVAGLNIDADLPFSSLYAPTQLHRVQFSAIAAAGMTGSNNKSLFVSDGTSGLVANELYWRNNSGNNVKISDGNSLNISVAGAIGGDYSSVGAELNYDDAGKRYTFAEGTSDSNGWARIASGEVRLFETGTTETLFVGHAAPSALAVSYTVTWPLAVPASTELVSMDASGNIAVAGQHGTRTLIIPVTAPTAPGVAISEKTLATPGMGFTVGIPLLVGDRITAVRAVLKDSATGPTPLRVRLFSAVAGSSFSVVATSSNSAGSGATQTITLSGLTTTIASGSVYYAAVDAPSGSASCSVYSVEVDYDRP